MNILAADPVPFICCFCKKHFAIMELRDDHLKGQWFVIDKETSTKAKYCPFCGIDNP